MKSAVSNYRILIADDHPLVRAGAKNALQQATEYEVVGECSRSHEALQKLRQLQPQLLILDILLGPECSLEWLDRYQFACPQIRVLVLSAMKNGEPLRLLTHPSIAGFVLKEEASEHLAQAVRVVASGGNWYSPAISAELRRMNEISRLQPDYHLTRREEEVFQRIKAAQDNASIAEALGISIHTVRRSISLIYSKMGVNGRVEAILRG